MRKRILIGFAVFLSAQLPLLAHAIVANQVDDFQDGTTLNWASSAFGAPNANPPANVSTGGPGGAGDRYLLLNSIGGMGPGSRLTAFNFFGQWSGDYINAGIEQISADVRNFGSNDLNLRLLIASVDGGGAIQSSAITDAIFLPTATDWTNVSFSVNPGDLFGLAGTIDDALSNAAILRIFDNDAASFPGAQQVASLSIDNIAALTTPVPLPPAVLLFISACAPLIWRKRRFLR